MEALLLGYLAFCLICAIYYSYSIIFTAVINTTRNVCLVHCIQCCKYMATRSRLRLRGRKARLPGNRG